MRRRDFISGVAAGGTALLIPSSGCAEKLRKGGKRRSRRRRSRVVIVRDPHAINDKMKIAASRVQPMLELGLRALTGDDDARAALARWVRPVDTVGLKVNCLAGRRMSTSVPLVEAMVALLQASGMPRKQALVFDRSDADLRSGGFSPRSGGKDYQVLGNDRAGLEKELVVMPSGASRCARVATRLASVLVNMPILKDHGLAGLSGALKNNFGLVHNPNKFHLNGCDPHVAEVNALPFVRDKQKLVVCDALRVQVDGGPAFHPAGAMPLGALLLATDPVALDLVAWELLEGLRKKKKLPTLAGDKRRPVHILTAGKQGLGVAARGQVELIEVTVKA